MNIAVNGAVLIYSILMMNAFRSYFKNDREKYAPVHRDIGAADNDITCIHCGQAARSLERSPKRLLPYVGSLLALALLVSLGIAVGREVRCIARERAGLPFTEVFGNGQYAFSSKSLALHCLPGELQLGKLCRKATDICS